MKYILAIILIILPVYPLYSATVTKTIGTTSRDYSTITLWEADLDDANIYSDGDDAEGEVYNDSAFDESVRINGGANIGGVGDALNSITLTVPASERHDGTAGTGARIVRTGASLNYPIISDSSVATTVEWLEIDANGQNYIGNVSFKNSSLVTATARYNLIHGTVRTGGTGVRAINVDFGSGSNRNAYIYDNIIYDMELDATAVSPDAYGIYDDLFNLTNLVISQNTVYGIVSSVSTTGNAYGIRIRKDIAATKVQNNISVDTTADNTQADFTFDSGTSNLTTSYNLSSDTTASGTGSLTSKSSSDQFVSTTGGSEDLHLKSGADAIDAGVDLGTTPSGVEIDIDGRDRDAQGDTWDMGADEFVSGVVEEVRSRMKSIWW